MGFSMVGSLGSQIWARNSHQRKLKFESFSHRRKHTLDFNFSKLRSHPAKILLSKRDAFEFEERTSPNEVNPLWIFIFSLVFFFFGVLVILQVRIHSFFIGQQTKLRLTHFVISPSFFLFWGFIWATRIFNRKIFWFSAAIPKHSFIGWLAMKDRLWTKARLIQWGFIGDSLCSYCKMMIETRNHLFFECPFSQRIGKP